MERAQCILFLNEVFKKSKRAMQFNPAIIAPIECEKAENPENKLSMPNECTSTFSTV
jgi:hypothetical protein